MTEKLLIDRINALLKDENYEELIKITDQVYEARIVATHLYALAYINKLDELDSYVFNNLDKLIEMKHFDQVMIGHIQIYNANKDFDRAKKILDKYQDLPYINQEFEESLIEAKNLIEKAQNDEVKGRSNSRFSEEEIIANLESGDADKITAVLPEFEKLRIDPYMEQIQSILLNEKLPFHVRVLSLIVLQDQKYSNTVKYYSSYIGHNINVIPSELKAPIDQTIFAKFEKKLASLKNPTINKIFKSYIEYWQLYRHPYKIDDSDTTYYGILYTVFKEFGEDADEILALLPNANVDMEEFHKIADELSGLMK